MIAVKKYNCIFKIKLEKSQFIQMNIQKKIIKILRDIVQLQVINNQMIK
jgi:hypothetical protein